MGRPHHHMRGAGWQFLVAAGTNILVVLLALFVLLPIRARHHRMPVPAMGADRAAG